MDSNQYAMVLVTYLLVLAVYFYELIAYMLLKRNAFDSIAIFSQCIYQNCSGLSSLSKFSYFKVNLKKHFLIFNCKLLNIQFH